MAPGQMKRHYSAISVILTLLLTGASLAGPCPDDRECVGLVLAGGGARGAAHIGVIEVMEELNVPVDFIVGTSMGAIIGGMYASGMSPAEMREQLETIDWEEAFNDDPPRRNIPFRQKEDDDRSLFKADLGFSKDGFKAPRGLVAGQKLNFILSSVLLHAATSTTSTICRSRSARSRSISSPVTWWCRMATTCPRRSGPAWPIRSSSLPSRSVTCC